MFCLLMRVIVLGARPNADLCGSHTVAMYGRWLLRCGGHELSGNAMPSLSACMLGSDDNGHFYESALHATAKASHWSAHLSFNPSLSRLPM